MEVATLEASLLDPGIEATWTDCLSGWVEATAAERQAVLDWAKGLREEFLQVARDVDDPDEVDYALAIRYIELKSHWIMLNTQINYQTVHRGGAGQELLFRASLISLLVLAIEPLLKSADIDKITDFLAEPIRRVGS